MKPSYYNNYIPLENGEYILYNTMSGAMLIIDEHTRHNIENIQQTEADLSGELLEQFKLNHLVVQDNENELTKIRDRYNAKRYNLQHVSFFLAPTAMCNLSCEYCWQRIDQSLIDKGSQTTTVSDPMLKNVLSFVKQRTDMCNARTLPITFLGGEPLMAKDLAFYILKDLNKWSEEHSINFKAGFYTNCTLFDQSFIDNLNEYTIFYVRTTLDGPQEIHDQYRHYKNGEGTYEHIVTNMGLILDAGIDVEIQVNINRHYKHAPELFDDLAERGLKKVLVTPYPVYDPPVVIQEVQKLHGIIDKSIPVPESSFAIPFAEVPEARLYVYKCAFERGFTLPQPSLGCLIPCQGANYYQYIVDPLGDVYKCVASMLLKFMRVGHIHENGRFERYPFLHEWMDTDPTYVEKCRSCKLLPSCGGGCVYGHKLIHVPYVCEVSPFYGEDYIKMYLKQKYADKLQSLKIE